MFFKHIHVEKIPASLAFSSARHLGTRIDALARPTTVLVHLVTVSAVVDAFSERALVVYRQMIAY